ncbi:MAG: phospho-N-acetylmuramoyl-pentapeptide-transferase [Clostridia bacterium]|nr:phospho-N-acetylmuramoyl-pentapeptide-transferase [Clostridia bacterium]
MQLWVLCATGILSFLISTLLGKWVIPALQRLHFGQTIREEGPAWHQSKSGTPTMGGVLFIAATVVTALLTILISQLFLDYKILSGTTLSLVKLFGTLLLALGCGLIGFLDDYIKVVKKRNLGLTARQKLIAQLLVATAFAVAMYLAGGHVIKVPFFGPVDFGFWYIPFCIFVIIAMSNATNLTDGVDGLCGSVSFIAVLPLVIIAGNTAAFGISTVAVAFAGALAGFLMWNLHPARVFMGDTGSLFIGALLTGLAFSLEQPFLLVPIGIIYIFENLSVILQVTYFKLTHGRRLFKMSPLHHHFELCNWSENKIVLVFSAVTVIGGVLALLLFFRA